MAAGTETPHQAAVAATTRRSEGLTTTVTAAEEIAQSLQLLRLSKRVLQG
jgi:hypothetical protein